MKTSRRLISALLAVMFVVTSMVSIPVFAAEFTDLTDSHDAYNAVNVLNKLGVINGYEDGSFKPDNNVTRAEFTAMLLRTRGMGSMGSTSLENPPFPDVVTSDVSWAIGNIRTAQGMGIINGYEDGTFRPKNNVSYEEAIKMIVCALGYENFGVAGNAWYSKYVMTANTLGFLEDSGGTIGTPATRATIAKMLYNCLEINLAENNEETDKTILENDLKLKKKVGYIASNSVTSLTTPDTNLRENEIEINAPSDNGTGYSTLTYKVDNAEEYKDMFGAQITFYYREDRASDTRTVILATTKNSEMLTVDARNIETGRCDATTLAYYKDKDSSSVTRASIDASAIVIYNDKLYGNTAASSTYSTYYGDKVALYGVQAALPTIGSLKLLDRNGDNKYDIVFVDDYETYIVSSIVASSKTIVDDLFRKGSPSNKIVLNGNAVNHEIHFVTEDGKETSFENIKTGNVLSIKRSNPANGGVNYITVEVGTKNTINGTIKSTVSGETATIAGVEYDYSYQAPWFTGTSAQNDLYEPAMNDSGRYYLDRNGDIFAYNKEEVKVNQHYGYLSRAPYDAGGIEGERLFLDIVMLDTGRVKRFDVYNKTKVNGHEFGTYYDLINDATYGLKAHANTTYTGSSTNADVAQLIKFTTTTYKDKEVVDNIITVTTTSVGEDVSGTALKRYTVIEADDVSKYVTSSKKMYKDSTSSSASINLVNTMVLSIPSDRTDSDGYRKMSLGELRASIDYKAEYYDVSKTTTATIMLVYEGSASSEVVSETSPLVVITEIPTSETNEYEATTMYKFVGYDARNNTDITGWVATESAAAFANVKKGDVIRLGKNSKGYYTLDARHILFGADVDRATVELGGSAVGANGVYEEVINGEGGASSPWYRVIWGSVKEKDANIVDISKKIITAETTPAEAAESVYSIARSQFNSARIYRYDTDASRDVEITEVASSENTATIDALSTYIQGTKPSEVFVYLVSNAVRLMIIVE